MTYVQPDEGLASPTVALQLGISFRQLDWWCSNGWLGEHLKAKGQGNHRRFTPMDIENARTLAMAARIKDLSIQELAARMAATRDLFAVVS